MAKMEFSSNTLTQPAWAGECLGTYTLIPAGAKLDPAQFDFDDAVTVTVGAAGAAVDDTTVPVDALSGKIPSGTVLDFGGDKFATLTADAAAGATSITVRALVTALVDDDTATYAGSTGRKPVKSGTLVGRTFAERAAGTAFGPAAVATDEEIYLIAFDVVDLLHENNAELYRHNCVVKENLLPDWATYTADEKAKIRELYQTVTGVN